MGLLRRWDSQGKDAGKGIGLSLVWLVLVAVMPLLIFGGGVAWMIVDQKKAAVADELASTARALRIAVDRELVSQFQAMEVLAADASLDSGNPAAFHDRAKRTVAVHSDWWNVGLINPNSHTIISSALPIPSPAPLTLSPVAADEVVRTRKPVIAGVFASGQLTKKPVVLFMGPVIRDNEVRHVLAVVMNPQPLSDIFVEQRLPASWTGAIVDTNMTLAGRSRAPERYIGVRATPTLADRIASSESGMFTALNQEGNVVYTVFSRSPITGWSVAIGVPAAEVEGPISHILLQLALAGGMLIAFALILTGMVGRSIVNRRNAYEQAIKESESRFRLMANFAPVFIWISDKDNEMTWFNQTALAFRGRSLEQEQGKGWIEGVHPDDFQRCFNKFVSHAVRRQAFTMEFRLKRHDGKYRWIFDCGTPRFDEEGNFLGYIGSAFDIHDRVEAETKLRTLSTAIEQSPISVVIADIDANIEYVNPRFEEVTGYTAQEAIGQNPRILKSGLTPEETYLELWSKVTSGQVWHGELVNKRKNGEIYWEDAHIAPVKDETGVVTRYVATKIDITQRKAMEEKIRHLAHHDPLTDLPNRTLLLDRLQQALAITRRDKTHLALLFIDLDRFKPINDSLGHNVGDLLLKEVAQRIQSCLRESDTVARIGGDEFVVLLPTIETEQDALGVAEKIRASLNQPFKLADQSMSISSSTGIALYPEHGSDGRLLIKNADTAMYYAKADGRNTVKIYQTNMQG